MAAIVKVSAKTQNRTALGIVHAYCAINPNCSFKQLQKAFPSSLCPDSGVKQLILPIKEALEFNTKMSLYFTKDGEPIILADGTTVALAQIWSGDSLQRIMQHALSLGIDASMPDKNGQYGIAGFALTFFEIPKFTAAIKCSFWQSLLNLFK